VAFLGYIVIQIAVNIAAVMAAKSFVPGVNIPNDFMSLLEIAGILAFFNIFLKPVAEMILGPFILVTFGGIILVINAVILWLATYFVPAFSFDSIIALAETTLILAVANFLIALARRA